MPVSPTGRRARPRPARRGRPFESMGYEVRGKSEEEVAEVLRTADAARQ